MGKKKYMLMSIIAVLLLSTSTAFAYSDSVIGKIKEAFAITADNTVDEKLSQLEKDVSIEHQSFVDSIKKEIRRNEDLVGKKLDKYIEQKFQAYKKNLDKAEKKTKSLIENTRNEAIQNGKLKVDEQFNQWESELKTKLIEELN